MAEKIKKAQHEDAFFDGLKDEDKNSMTDKYMTFGVGRKSSGSLYSTFWKL